MFIVRIARNTKTLSVCLCVCVCVCKICEFDITTLSRWSGRWIS